MIVFFFLFFLERMYDIKADQKHNLIGKLISISWHFAELLSYSTMATYTMHMGKILIITFTTKMVNAISANQPAFFYNFSDDLNITLGNILISVSSIETFSRYLISLRIRLQLSARICLKFFS